MKAISLWQPWATWVMLGWKTIETRDHARFFSLIGHRVAIHAAKHFDKTAVRSFAEYRRSSLARAEKLCNSIEYDEGKILCTAVVRTVGWRPALNYMSCELNKKAVCDTKNKYLLFLKDIKQVYPAVPFIGRQGIFNVPDELVTKPYLQKGCWHG